MSTNEEIFLECKKNNLETIKNLLIFVNQKLGETNENPDFLQKYCQCNPNTTCLYCLIRNQLLYLYQQIYNCGPKINMNEVKKEINLIKSRFEIIDI